MEFLKFMSVPAILFMVVVAPIWIVMHYRSLNRSSRSLSDEDRESIKQAIELRKQVYRQLKEMKGRGIWEG